MMRRVRLGILAISVLLLAGCSQIPTSGPVGVGPTSKPNDPAIVFLPRAPQPGESQEDIVSGFVQAASAGDDFSVARQFLTPKFAPTWQPRARVLVYDDAGEVRTRSATQLSLDVTSVAEVNADGSYTASSSARSLPFGLERVDGQWRISSAPIGILLAEKVFQRLLKPVPLQFFDASYTRLVPDVRWFRSPTSQASASVQASTIVRALVTDPTGVLGQGVAVTAFPDRTRVRSVSTGADGVMTVVLAVQGGDPSTEAATRMQQQIAASLPLAPTSLRLIVNGRTMPAASEVPTQGAASASTVLLNGRFGSLQSSGTVSEDAVLGKRIEALKPTEVTVSDRQPLAAVLAKGRVVLVTPTGAPVVDTRLDLVAPTLDQRGWTYSVPMGDSSGLWAISSKGRRVSLSTTELGGLEVHSIEVSPDGTRMLVLVQTGKGPQAYVAGITRSADGTPTGLTSTQAAVDLPTTGLTAQDATWTDDDSVAVLASGTDGNDVVVAQQLGALSTQLGQLANAVSIVGSGGQLVARVDNGNLLVREINVWQSAFATDVDVTVLAVQR